MWQPILERLWKLADARGRWLIGGVLLVAAGMALAIPGLRVTSSYRDLMPADRPEQQDYDAFLEEFGAANDLIVVIEGEAGIIRPAADRLAKRLLERGSPVADVFYRIDLEEMADRAPLYIELPALRKLLEEVERQEPLMESLGNADGLSGVLEQMSGLFSLSGEGEAWTPESAERAVAILTWGLAEWRGRLENPGRSGFHLPPLDFGESEGSDGAMEELAATLESGGYLGSRDNRMVFLFVRPDRTSDDPVYLATVEEAVREEWRALVDADPEGMAGAGIAFTGLPAHILTDVRSLREDIIRASAPSAALVFLILWIGLRSIRRTLIALIALGCGMAISLGLARFVFGELNRMSMSFLAIMFGIGIDFGIYLVRRTDEEIGRGRGRREAVRTALTRSGQGIVVGGLVTALAFSVTAVSEFRGTSQLGLITAISVVVVLVTTLLLLPPLLMRMPTKRKAAPPAPEGAVSQLADEGFDRDPAEASPGVPSPAVAGSVRRAGIGLLGFVAVAIFGIVVAPRVPVDYNGLSVMPRNAESTEYQIRMQEESDFQMTSAVIRAPDRDSMRALVEKVRELPTVAKVVTLGDLLPDQQEEKRALLRDHEGALAFSAPKFFDPAGGGSADDYESALVRFEEALYEVQELAFTGGRAELTGALEKALAEVEMIRESFADRPVESVEATRAFERELQDGMDRAERHIGKWRNLDPVTEDSLPSGFVNRFRSPKGNYAAFVYPSGSVWEMEFLDTFLEELQAVAPDATGFPVISQSNVGLLTKGIFQSLLLTVVVVIVLLSIDLRRWNLVLYALFPLLVGMALLHAWLFVTGQQFNLASINGLPLLLGLGVVYGVHIVHRWKEAPDESAFRAVKTSGRAICLAGITTMAGLASLTLCIHQGVASFGWLLLQGIVCMLVAALFALPLAIDWFSVRGKRGDA